MEQRPALSSPYLEFEVQIEPPRDDGLSPVQVLRAPAGEANGTLDAHVLAEIPATAPTTVHEARTRGGALFEALFQGEVRNRLDVSKQLAAADHAGLRVRLRIEDPVLAALPWELLFDARSDEFLALARATPLVRYLPLGAPAEPLTVEPPLRILAVVAAPADLPPVDVAGERARLQEAVAALQKRRHVELVWLEGETWAALQSALQEGPWHILHYVGHAFYDEGAGSGALVLADDAGQSAPVSATDLGALLKDHPSLRLVVLNACEGARSGEASLFAGLGAALVQSGLPAVVAMQYEISTAAAAAFTRAFYGAIAHDLPVDAAVAEARKFMRQAAADRAGGGAGGAAGGGAGGGAEWATPVLFLRAPDGALWHTVQPPVLSLRRALAAAAAAVIGLLAVGALVWWVILPTFFPTQMDAPFGIAVAGIGELDEGGNMHKSPFGTALSTEIYARLLDEYNNARLGAGGSLESAVVVWNDSAGRSQKNVRFGAIPGATAEARAQAAAALARRIGAEMVVYGFITPRATGQDLQLEFYYATPIELGEPLPTAGSQRIGAPIVGATSYRVNAEAAHRQMDGAVQVRATGLFWITQVLSYLLADQPEKALEVARSPAATRSLEAWRNEDGRQLWHLVVGQAALYARDYESALAEAELAGGSGANGDEPDVNALMLAGNTYMDRSQLHYLRYVDVDPADVCVDARNLEAASPTPAEAADDAHRAVELLEQATALAPTSPWPPVENFARMNLALAYRLLGQVEIFAGNMAAADTALALAVNGFDQTLQAFDAKTQPQYAGWSQAGLGVTRLLQAHIRNVARVNALNAQDAPAAAAAREDAVTLVEESIGALEACIAQEPNTMGSPTFQQQVLHCACRPYLQQAQTTLADLEEGP